MLDLRELINHPELMDRDTLYELRSMLALYPYYQTPRLLMLQNLYLLHDPSFDEELRRAAVYITDRKVIFQMIEAAHYQLRHTQQNVSATTQPVDKNRTLNLIDSFLDSIPDDIDEETNEKPAHHRRPTPADAAVDYVAYLLATEEESRTEEHTDAPKMKGQSLIDNFLEQEQGRILLNELPDEENESRDKATASADDSDEEYFTETLARIYIKQGRYQKAYDIIQRLGQQFPEKNVYFTDQLRFLDKLIINSKNK